MATDKVGVSSGSGGVSTTRGKSACIHSKDSEVRGSERRHEFVVETRARGKGGGNTKTINSASVKGTYADLLTNLLVYDDVDECS